MPKPITEEHREKLREAGRKGGLAKNPNKGFAANPDLAREMGRLSRPRRKANDVGQYSS